MTRRDKDKSKRLLALQVELDLLRDARTALSERERSIKEEIRSMADVAVGQHVESNSGRIAKSERVAINTIEIDTFGPGDKHALVLSGTGSPITKSGVPSKSTHSVRWSKAFPEVWFTTDEYMAAHELASKRHEVTPAEITSIAARYEVSPLSDFQNFARAVIQFLRGKESGQLQVELLPVPEPIRDPANVPDPT